LKTIADFSPHGLIPSCDSSRSDTHPVPATVATWPSKFSSILGTLQHLASATEHDFLQIGSQMQEMYRRTHDLSGTANQLVEAASGEHIRTLMDRLRQILQEMEAYLVKARQQNFKSAASLELVGNLLKRVAEPLEGFKKMSKQLYILEVSVKIESTYLGDMGSEFLNLAQDIKKLSQQIKEKANTVHDHRLSLSTMIKTSIADIHAANSSQDTKVKAVMRDTETSVATLESVNQRFSILGDMISSVSKENSDNISEIVQSMQFHDIYRQQLEHVIEAIKGLIPSDSSMHDESHVQDDPALRKLVGNAGDVCELQEAQLHFASAEFYSAVASIVTNLRNISLQQKQIGRDVYTKMGAIDNTSNASFIDDVGQHMSSITNLLTACVDTNKELAGITKKVANEVDKITGFVTDIEDIGHEITQIALNSRIKAACTGKNGASLSALSEEVGQLSNEAVGRADSITATLTEIQSATEILANEAESNEKILDVSMSSMKGELKEVLKILEEMGKKLTSLLPQIQHKVSSLAGEIEKITNNIDVHKRAKVMADEVLANLQQISGQARELYPASAEFKENLRRLAGRYTMESERRIHEDIARKHGNESLMTQTKTQTKAEINSTGSSSEFGDNVDLF
jgi:methyl-accepting chemotaxis protein